MGAIYPELVSRREIIESALKKEEQQFALTLDQGMKIQQDFFWVLMCVFMLISAIFATIVGLITGLILKKEDAAY